MLNPFVLKKWAAISVLIFLPTIMFTLGNVFFGFMWSIAFFFGGGLIAALISTFFLLRHPFTDLLEGKGVLAINLDSTGILRLFMLRVFQPFLRGRLDADDVEDIFDREAVMNLAAPKTAGSIEFSDNKDEVIIKLNEAEYNKGRFALFHWPVILYNGQLKSIMTKDFFSEIEKTSFAEHTIIYLNRKLEELTSITRDFARYIVELTRPKDKKPVLLWIMWVVLVVGLIIIAVLFAPSIIKTISTMFGSGSKAVNSAAEAVGAAKDSAVIPK